MKVEIIEIGNIKIDESCKKDILKNHKEGMPFYFGKTYILSLSNDKLTCNLRYNKPLVIDENLSYEKDVKSYITHVKRYLLLKGIVLDFSESVVYEKHMIKEYELSEEFRGVDFESTASLLSKAFNTSFLIEEYKYKKKIEFKEGKVFDKKVDAKKFGFIKGSDKIFIDVKEDLLSINYISTDKRDNFLNLVYNDTLDEFYTNLRDKLLNKEEMFSFLKEQSDLFENEIIKITNNKTSLCNSSACEIVNLIKNSNKINNHLRFSVYDLNQVNYILKKHLSEDDYFKVLSSVFSTIKSKDDYLDYILNIINIA
ncbi:MAG: hypothetical protein R3Y64_09290 [Peptostreptococcaceae bacterium]